MATNWPTSRDTFTNPSSSSTLDSPSHAAQHANINDAVEAMQLYAGLVLVKSQTIGSGVSSVTVTDAFSSTFDNYRIMVAGGAANTSNDLRLQLGATTTGYYTGVGYHPFGTAGPSNVQGLGLGNVANFQYCGSGSTGGLMMNVDLISPYLSNFTCMATNHAIINASGSIVFSNGFLNNSSSYTAFTIITSTGTMTGGTIRVYGYNNG